MFQICEYCNKYFRIFSLYEKHIWNVHSRSPQQEALMKSTSTKKKKKVKVKVIKPKIVIEKPKQKVGCDECGKVFMSSSYIELHKKQVHSKQKDYGCSDCNIKFSRQWSLTCHIRLHTGELPHTCEYWDTKV